MLNTKKIIRNAIIIVLVAVVITVSVYVNRQRDPFNGEWEGDYYSCKIEKGEVTITSKDQYIVAKMQHASDTLLIPVDKEFTWECELLVDDLMILRDKVSANAYLIYPMIKKGGK